jgi:hypothetical protein
MGYTDKHIEVVNDMIATRRRESKCACYATFIVAEGTKIDYCPLHAAAPLLLEALKRVLPLVVGEVPGFAIDALAAAEGK